MEDGLTKKEIDAINLFIARVENIEFPYPESTIVYVQTIYDNFMKTLCNFNQTYDDIINKRTLPHNLIK